VISFFTCTSERLACVGTDTVIATCVGSIVALIRTTWCWSNWIGVVLTLVFNLCKHHVPISTNDS
jgi:hypothetical protein